ncbi:unnamed protein product [Rhizoctonia solani]|uniref:Fanconi-associated nuclease n=1 Tax=Rhizoctonia solani TaxID=456999 RepID=A0A8H2WS58_9AGAM|nr:unnamed protein product [Rhizoctonia solani]
MQRNYFIDCGAAMMFFRDEDFDPPVKEEEVDSADILLQASDIDGKRVMPSGCSQLEPDDQSTSIATSSHAEHSKSMYVIKLLEMIDTVLEFESHLFSSSEITILNGIKHANYFQQYLISRIVQRKRGKWLRFDQLNESYAPEFRKHAAEADVPKIIADTLLELSGNFHLKKHSSVASSEKDVIDLTLDSDDEDIHTPKHDITGKPMPHVNAADPSASSGPTSSQVIFLEDSTVATPAQLLECLSVEELKLMGKRLKIPSKTKSAREELMNAILRSTSTQTTLPFAIVSKAPRSSSKKDGNDWRGLFPFKQASGKTQNMPLQERRIRDLCSETYGSCFRLLNGVAQVLHLVSVVYFRSTEQSEANSIMLSAILSLSGKRNYPTYEYKRTGDVFPTRTDLLRFIEVSLLLNEVENLLAGVGLPRGVKFDRLKASQDVIDIWETHRDRWNSLVAYLKDKAHRERGLERFEEGYLLTRLAYKAADCFGALKQYDLEAKLLEALLRQTRWRRGKRGHWYDRLALIYTRYMGGGDANLRQAREYLLTALQDDLVSIGSRPMLLRRLQRLEKQLRLPLDEQYVGEGDLKVATETQIEGTRIYTPQTSTVPPKGIASKVASSAAILMHLSGSPSSSLSLGSNNQGPKHTGKTIWAGEEGEVNVETFALEHYVRLGFKGFHSEGTIVLTLFGLLFWDILFAPIPGAFETPYQSAPLDLVHDSFFGSREEIINARLEELRSIPGAACQIAKDVYLREREREPWCVGVRWDLFEQEEELVEIIDCLGGPALAAICRLLAEEYGSRRGGVPDLFIWNATQKTCKFIEVKGPGDNLSETQKVWIDVLLSAGVDVEVCRVYEHGNVPIRAAKGKNKVKEEPQRRSTSRKRTPKASKDVFENHASKPEPEEEDELQSSSEDEPDAADVGNPSILQGLHPQRTSKAIAPPIVPASPGTPGPPESNFAKDSSVLLRPITSLPAPALPMDPNRAASVIPNATEGVVATQRTILSATPQARSPSPILARSPVSTPAPESYTQAHPKVLLDSKPPQPTIRPSASPQKSHLLSNKEWRDMLKASPAKKVPKREAIASPIKRSSPTIEPTPKRKRGDSTAHTPTRESASSAVTDTPKRAEDDNANETTRSPRKRRCTNEQAGVSGNPAEWEKIWPKVFPKWVGNLSQSSDPDYEPSQ